MKMIFLENKMTHKERYELIDQLAEMATIHDGVAEWKQAYKEDLCKTFYGLDDNELHVELDMFNGLNKRSQDTNREDFIKSYGNDIAMVSEEMLREFLAMKAVGDDYYEAFGSEGTHMMDCWLLWNHARE